MWNEIKFKQFLNNILDIKNISEYINLLEKYNKYSENFVNFVLYYPEFIKKTLKSEIEKTDVIQLDPTNPKIKYILEQSDNILLYILENKDKLNHLRDFLDWKLMTWILIMRRKLTKKEFYEEILKEYKENYKKNLDKFTEENNQKRTRSFKGADNWYNKKP